MEKTARQLAVGDTIIAKQGGKRYTIDAIVHGVAGPYLMLIDEKGKGAEHDTSWDSRSATYTVKEPLRSEKGAVNV